MCILVDMWWTETRFPVFFSFMSRRDASTTFASVGVYETFACLLAGCDVARCSRAPFHVEISKGQGDNVTWLV